MTKEELEKEAREYLAEHSEYSEVFGQTFVAVDTLTAMVEFAEPREKQIAELSKHIVELQNDKGELIDRCRELEAQIDKMKADVKQGQSYWNSGEMQYDLYQRLLDKWEIKEK